MQQLVRTNTLECRWRSNIATQSGAVLLEVVLALVLFAFAAVVIGGGLRSSMQSVERLRLNMHAADLAVTALSEVQLGLRSVEITGAELMDPPFDDWMCEVVPAPSLDVEMSSTRYHKVEVVISREDPPLVYRVGQFLRVEQAGSSETADLTAY